METNLTRTCQLHCCSLFFYPVSGLEHSITHSFWCVMEADYHRWQVSTVRCLLQQTEHVLNPETTLQLEPFTVFCEYLSKQILM